MGRHKELLQEEVLHTRQVRQQQRVPQRSLRLRTSLCCHPQLLTVSTAVGSWKGRTYSAHDQSRHQRRYHRYLLLRAWRSSDRLCLSSFPSRLLQRQRECSRDPGVHEYFQRGLARHVRQALGTACPLVVAHRDQEVDVRVDPIVCGLSLALRSTIAGCSDPIVVSSQGA
jgi:hypothetical protein